MLETSASGGAGFPGADDELTSSAAAERNKAAILDVLMHVVPPHASVLEVASGTGQHAAHFAAARADWQWQPTDGDPQAMASIEQRTSSLPNVLTPLRLDVLASRWPPSLGRFDALFCANLLHIAAWPACEALMRGAADHLVDGGSLVLYGPYFVEGEVEVPGNVAFDADLRRRDPGWGVRRLADVVGEANKAGLSFGRRFDMPANNLILVFGRTGN